MAYGTTDSSRTKTHNEWMLRAFILPTLQFITYIGPKFDHVMDHLALPLFFLVLAIKSYKVSHLGCLYDILSHWRVSVKGSPFRPSWNLSWTWVIFPSFASPWHSSDLWHTGRKNKALYICDALGEKERKSTARAAVAKSSQTTSWAGFCVE